MLCIVISRVIPVLAVVLGYCQNHKTSGNTIVPLLESFCCKKVQTKKLVLGDFQNIGHLKVLNDTKLVLNGA